MANYTWPPAPPATVGAESENIPTEYGKEPDLVFDPPDWEIPGGPFDAGTINDMVVAIEDIADAVEDIADTVNEIAATLDSDYLDSNFEPIDIDLNIDINGSGGQSYPPNYNPAYGDGVRANMQQYVGDSWDGSTAGVTMINTWETNSGISPPPGAPAGWDGDIGPGGGSPAGTITLKLQLPHNGEVYSSKYSFKRSVNGYIKLGLYPPTGSAYQWHPNYTTIVWMSSTPGGNPHIGYNGNPHMYKFGVEITSKFGTYYDRDLISVANGLSEREGIRTTLSNSADIVRLERAPYGGKTWETYMTSSGGDYVFPVIEKTYFLNWAMVLSSSASAILERGTPPTSSERKSLTGLTGQYGLVGQTGAYDVGGSYVHSLDNYLDVTRYQTLDSHRGYIGIDKSMADFMWDSESSFLSDSEYTPLSSSDVTLITAVNDGNKTNVSDVGFEGPDRYKNSIWSRYHTFGYNKSDRVRYVIPQDGKIATIEFTTAYGMGVFFTTEGETPSFDARNSTFDLSWTPHNDDKTRAWYDLGLTPVMWMSAEPAGEPQPIHDMSRGVVIAIPPSGATYEGQQIVSTSEVQFMGGTSSTRATFPITNHKYYLNVGVVENDVARELEATGVAPTASQLQTWSINDPSLTYTPTDEQLMYLNGIRRGIAINGGGS